MIKMGESNINMKAGKKERIKNSNRTLFYAENIMASVSNLLEAWKNRKGEASDR